MIAVDEYLPAARKHLDDAISILVDPKPDWRDGSITWVMSWLEQLLIHIAGTTRERSGGSAGCPIWPDAFDLARDIEVTVAGWQKGETTQHRLRLFGERKWRPQDAPQMHDHATSIERWVDAIRSLLDPISVKEISEPCPACGATAAYRRNTAGEMVRSAALQLTIDQCKCLKCRVVWQQDHFQLLAAAIGCDKPAGVVKISLFCVVL